MTRPALAALLATTLVAPAGAQPAASILRGGDPQLLRLAARLQPTLEKNRKRFEGRTGPVEGFGAGEAYPQVWLRDSATLVPLSRWLYPRATLRSWLAEHLAAQNPDGSLNDWIAAGPPEAFREWAPRVRALPAPAGLALSADTNTTEADQEASAVLAAHEIFAATGDLAWLVGPVAGQPLLKRLDRALRSVLERRFDSRRGLVENALTADWGDVSPAYPDQRAIYLDERTPRAVGLYTNALFVRAARCLAVLHSHTGDGVAAAFWWQKADQLGAGVQGLLWQETRGFYRMQLVTTPQLAPGFPETADVFALGGNAVALLAGLGDERQVARVLAVAEQRRLRHRLATVAGVLLPPLPRGTFPHPVLRDEGQYQNGGEWDWFAGRLLTAAFQRGQSAWARTQLQAVAAAVERASGLHEWRSRDGRGRGSASYAGSAGALGEALVAGLYGVTLTGGRLDLHVRLGGEAGAIELRPPDGRPGVRYDYRFERTTGRAVLTVESNAPVAGTLALRLPEGFRPLKLERDGQALSFEERRVGEDVYAVAGTSWGRHRFDLKLARRPG